MKREPELLCPVCDIPLLETRASRAVAWTCPSCHGRAIGVALLRRTMERSWATELWADATTPEVHSEHVCPSCRRAMLEANAGGLTLDICRACHMAWFDRDEYDNAPKLPEPGARTLPQEALERIARRQALAIAAEYKLRYGQTMSGSEALPLVPGLAGLPLEEDVRGLSRYPWVTWAVAAVLTLLGIWSLARPDAAARYGLIAADLDRLGGATLITSLLVHATWFQLLTNVYFLLFFGDNVEDFLGPVMFGTLFFVGGLAGNVLHALFAAESAAVLIGASGSISAIVVFYACRFPDARLRFIRLFRWHTMPALAGLLFWLLTKLASSDVLFGRAEPTAWPFVGGALVGLVFWWVLREN